jgi:hypothetical protein
LVNNTIAPEREDFYATAFKTEKHPFCCDAFGDGFGHRYFVA